MELLADTVFLIDLWREQQKAGPAVRFAQQHHSETVGLCWVVYGEFLSGSLLAGQDTEMVLRFLNRYPVVHSDLPIVETYSRLFAQLKQQNKLVGPNDL